LIGLKVQKNISVKPEGDIISLNVTNRHFNSLMLLLKKLKLTSKASASVSANQPLFIISKSSSYEINNDVSATAWEEMQANMNKESISTINSMLIMFIAGMIAVIGIVTNALHIVIGAMVIAPGFAPITRFSLGIVTESTDWKSGLRDTFKTYSALLAGAFIASFIMQSLGYNLISGKSSYLPLGVLVSYWTSINTSSIIITISAAIAGALVIITNRSVLTAGVMIALALIPATSIIGIGIVAGDFDVAGNAAIRLFLEIGIVAIASALTFLWKKYSVYKREMFV
jgi:uncharacterized membrane protein